MSFLDSGWPQGVTTSSSSLASGYVCSRFADGSRKAAVHLALHPTPSLRPVKIAGDHRTQYWDTAHRSS